MFYRNSAKVRNKWDLYKNLTKIVRSFVEMQVCRTFASNKDKMGIKGWLITTIIVLLAIIVAGWQQVKYADRRWKTAEANVKAYSSELSATGQKNTALQLTVDQLEYFNDSVLQALDATRKALKVKDKNLKALQAVKSSFSKRDTIMLRDTLFKEPALDIDTLMGDEWYTLRLGLRYPSMVAVKPEFKSEKHIVVSTKKETVNPPKKFFLLRWFQKKHLVIHIDVVEKNPYVEDETSKYIEIVK